MILKEDDINTKSAAQLFEEYIEVMYKLKPRLKDPKYKALVDALRDAYFAGMAIASISQQDFTLELLAYAREASAKPLSDVEGWIH